MIPAARRAVAAALVALVAVGCARGVDPAGLAWVGAERERAFVETGLLGVLWMDRLVPQDEGPYVPVERGAPALDPARDRVYAGTTQGHLWALTSGGRRLYRFHAGGAIEATPALDRATQTLFFGTEQGKVHALSAPRGERLWTADVGSAVRTSPALAADAVYVVTHADEVVALSRATGEVLWEYAHQEGGAGFSITEHAGPTLDGRTLYTAFTDGSVVAFDAATGAVRWVRDTSRDLLLEGGDPRTRFFDVDTTPIVAGDVVYVASFAGGLFALEASNGGVRWRDAQRTGVVALALDPGGDLLLASADEGIARYDPEARRVLWARPLERGTPSGFEVADGLVLSASSRGSFVARRLSDGRELARFEGSAGFSAPPAVAGGLGFAMSNDGALYAFRVRASTPRAAPPATSNRP